MNEDQLEAREREVLAAAAVGDNIALNLALDGNGNPIAVATALLVGLQHCADRISIDTLRRLAFLLDQSSVTGPGGSRRDIISCVEIRRLARAEMKRRGEWSMRDRLRAIPLAGSLPSQASARLSRSGARTPD